MSSLASTYVVSVATQSRTYYLPYENHEWEISSGFEAPIHGWVAPKDVAEAILLDLGTSTGLAREVTLSFGDPESPTVVQRVVVIGTGPAGNPQKRMLYLSNVLWYFTRAWLVYDFNERRRVGDTRLVGDSLLNSTVVDTIAYTAWSIDQSQKPAKAHTWASARSAIVNYLSVGKNGRPDVEFVVDYLSLNLGPQVIQETSSDSPATVGLARVIEATPGAGVYVGLDGKIHIHDRVPGSEKAVVDALPPPLKGHGDVVWVDRSSVRPVPSANSYRVLLDYELELRCDFNPPGSGDVTDSALVLALQATQLDNVLQVTDRILLIPAGPWGAERTVGQGTWITMAEAYAAWSLVVNGGGVKVDGAGPVYGSIALPKLTDDIVARHWFGNALQRYTVGGAVTTYDNVWSARIDELMRRYRTTFRVSPSLWDHVRHAWAVRAAVWDPATGTRAPAPVYSNFNKKILDHFASCLIVELSKNDLSSYATTGLLADGHPSGFGLKFDDEELGIFSILRDVSKFPDAAELAPSPVQVEATRTGDAGLNESTLQQLDLTNGPRPWRLAVVFSISSGAPNNNGRFYEVQVSTGEAAEAVGFTGYGAPGYAPDQELRCQLGDARVAWQDGKITNGASIPVSILNTIGAMDLITAITDGDPSLTPAVGPLTPINLTQELTPLARAVAGADLLSKQDHYEGSRAFPIHATSTPVVPIGSLDRVVYKVTKNRAVCVIHCTGHARPIHFEDFLKGAARSFLLKEIATRR